MIVGYCHVLPICTRHTLLNPFAVAVGVRVLMKCYRMMAPGNIGILIINRLDGDINHQELVCLKCGIAEFLAVCSFDHKLRVFGKLFFIPLGKLEEIVHSIGIL